MVKIRKSRNEKYLWNLVNGTKEMLSNNPTVTSELDYWMDICTNFFKE